MNNARTVLIVDDDALLRAMLIEYLMKAGFRVLEAASVAEARQRLHSASNCDAMILDVLLPDGDGRSFCTELRKSGFPAPDPAADRLDELLRPCYGIGLRCK